MRSLEELVQIIAKGYYRSISQNDYNWSTRFIDVLDGG